MRATLSTALAFALCAAAPATAESLLAVPGTGADLVLRSGAGPIQTLGAGAAKALPGGGDATLRQMAGDGERWWAAGTATVDGASRLVLLHGGANDKVGQGTPAPATAASLVFAPSLLVADGALQGLAWLSGERHGRFAVQVARWEGDHWGAVETVAPPPASGSRVSLAAAVLADGSWLLAWSAFDGRDDEIWWTRRGSEGWSEPRRVGVNDEVPDITPALRAIGDGALIAWSEYDGRDYRMRLASFDGEDFRAAGPIGGKGATFPRFDGAAAADQARLLYRDVEGGGWSVAELDGRGKVLRRAKVLDAGAEAPALAADAGGITFKWLERDIVKSARVVWTAP